MAAPRVWNSLKYFYSNVEPRLYAWFDTHIRILKSDYGTFETQPDTLLAIGQVPIKAPMMWATC